MVFWTTLSLRRKVQIAFIVVSLLSVGIFTWQAAQRARDAALAAIDAKLHAAAVGYVHVVGERFHDDIVPRDQVSLEDSRALSKKIKQYAKSQGMPYAYSFVQWQGKTLFAQSSFSDDEMNDGKTNWYLTEYENKAALAKVEEVFAKGRIDTLEYTDQYGAFRTLYVPLAGPGGARFVVAADEALASVDRARNDALASAAIAGGAVLALAIAVSVLLGNMIARPLQRLDAAVHQLTTGSGLNAGSMSACRTKRISGAPATGRGMWWCSATVAAGRKSGGSRRPARWLARRTCACFPSPLMKARRWPAWRSAPCACNAPSRKA